MAEKEASAEPTGTTNAPSEDMDLKSLASPNTGDVDNSNEANNGDSNAKREREDDEESDEVSKKQKVEKNPGSSEPGLVRLGPKEFGSSVEMFDYFFNLLRFWPTQLNFNKYEHLVLLELLKKGHLESDKKIGGGIKAFQIRNHPTWKSKCFFIIRDDETVDDFSFRKCVDHILPLPEDMKIKPDANRASGGGRWKGHGGRGGGRGHVRGGKSGN